MSQRILSCPSTLFTKGVSLKASDWSKPEQAVKSCINVSSTPSVLSMPKNWRPAAVLSSTEFNRQFDLQRPSSSSLASNGTGTLFKSRSNSTLTNAAWDEIEVNAPASMPTNAFALAVFKAGESAGNWYNMFRGATRPGLEETLKPSAKTDTAAQANFPDVGRTYSESSLEDVVSNPQDAAPASRGFVVEIFPEKVPRQVDILNMTPSDLASLKHDDAFMYNSIPAVHEAALQGRREIDHQTLQSIAKSSNDLTYTRKSRISCESRDFEMDFDEVSSLLNSDGDGENVDEEDDLFISYFEKHVR